MARLDATTGLADSFDPNGNGPLPEPGVYAVVVQADGKILACGRFGNIGGQPRGSIARLDAVTGQADSWNPDAAIGLNGVYSMAVQADGKIVVGYAGATIGGQLRYRIARLDDMTGLADSFDPNASFFVYAVALQADGKILAGGGFSGPNSIGGQTRSFFARLTDDTAALQDLAVTQTTITWTRGGSSPQFARVTFESSTDNVNYSALGNGTSIGSNWTLTGLNLRNPTEHLHPRPRFLPEQLLELLGKHHGISAECFYHRGDFNADSDTDGHGHIDKYSDKYSDNYSDQYADGYSVWNPD